MTNHLLYSVFLAAKINSKFFFRVSVNWRENCSIIHAQYEKSETIKEMVGYFRK